MTFSAEDQLVANVAAGLALDAVEAAGHGHPGTAVALAPVAQLLFRHHLRHDPLDPMWQGRDRFVLSCGHASMLLYAQLYLSGYGLSIDDLKQFRKAESLTPGHPEYGHTTGVEMTTGPLGQGLATAVGMAWAQLSLANRFDPANLQSPLKTHVYVIASDGDLAEGITSEAGSFAGTHQISNLTVIYDDNQISIDGDVRAAFDEDVIARYQSYGWNALRIAQLPNGQIDIKRLDDELRLARASNKPTLIALKTSIAFPSPNMTGLAATHGSPMGTEEVKLTKSALGLDPNQFFQGEALAEANQIAIRKRATELKSEYLKNINSFQQRNPVSFKIFNQLENFDPDTISIPEFNLGDSIATRKASQKVLDELAILPQLIGGSADLTESNGVAVKNLLPYHGANPSYGALEGRRLMFGIREHAMAAFANGVALASPLRPFVATFLIFSDYMRPSIRLAGLMNLPVVWVFSHDSIGLGEDGPTHQPVEHLWSLRAIPNIAVVRPADGNETIAAWKQILKSGKPSAIVLSRQNLPIVTQNPEVQMGAYLLSDPVVDPMITVIATGSEVQIALTAASQLAAENIGVRVISAPCLEWFENQSSQYKSELLGDLPKIAIEAGSELGWWKYVGRNGKVIGVTDYGASASPDYLFKRFGLTVENLITQIRELI